MNDSPQAAGASTTPNGAPPILIRRYRKADPLVRKKPHRRPQPTQPALQGAINGQKPMPSKPAPVKPPYKANPEPPEPTGPKDSQGFSTYAGEQCQYFPVRTTKRALLDGLRHHVARFASHKNVDPQNQNDFLRPVRLQRRDPRAPPAGAGANKDGDVDMMDIDSKEGLLEMKEREKQEIIKAERDAQRQADLAQMAPNVSAGQNARRKLNPSKKKTQQGRRTYNTPEEKARKQLRYEEAIPWHLEDFDNKNTWVGNYESALSDTYCMLALSKEGHFRFVPLERWYKFTPKNQFKTLTIEEAEAAMQKKVAQPRWVMDFEKKKQEQQILEADHQSSRKLFMGRSDFNRPGLVKSEAVDADELDFEEDRFADDEENADLGLNEEEQEETKQAADRIKRNQLAANIFDLKDEKEVDAVAELERREREREAKEGKKVKKALKRREKNFLYASDSDSESDTENEDSVKKEDDKSAEKGKGKDSEKLPSGASSKGNNTPSGRNKVIEVNKKGNSSNKRPGSPNLSEASGTESIRKKQKKKHGLSQPATGSTSNLATGPSSSAPEAGRAGNSGMRKSSIVKLPMDAHKLNEISSHPPRPDLRRSKTGPGSSSDGEATGGDRSDGGHRKKKMKLRIGGSPTNGSPTGSRAVSPQPPNASFTGRSRAASPGESRPGENTSTAAGVFSHNSQVIGMTATDVLNAIPPEGISTADAMTILKPLGFVRELFVKVVKEHCVMEEDSNGKKLVFLRPGVTAAK
ncbi:MAG: hypothetical protein M1814_005983 [Vezdaea aestivalis]|nr:MAG: hypothetical protein M1814_005983 [Vezdaea aestivalis]